MHRVGLAERSLTTMLDELAAETPAPGGGSAAAWTCALAAGLVEMAAAFTRGRAAYADRQARMAEIGNRARALRERAVELGEAELHAYEPVLEALRMSRHDPQRAARVAAARSQAAESPLAIARVGAELAELGAAAAAEGNPHLIGDAVTGAVLAEAACRAAAQLVELNLTGVIGDGRRVEVARLLQRAASARARALGD